MTARHGTMERASVAAYPTASRCVASSRHQHQKWTRTGRAYPWGTCAPIPAVVYGDMQACELGGRVGRPSFSRISHRLFLLPSRYLRVSAFAGAPRTSHSVASRVSSTARLNTLADQNVCQCASDPLHSLTRLSSSLVSVGIDPNENGLTHAQIPFAPGANSYD